MPTVNPIARAHGHVPASVATTPEPAPRRGDTARAVGAGSGQTAAGSIRFRDAYQWKKEPVLAETDSDTELDPTPWTLVVWVNVSLWELYPSASAVALAIAELP